ncbi:MAG TPA: hypothetical protein VMB21_17290 [Candidatus Limnocylindria bacterium]|jgi:hypothetical protein|nr:hypothetical protein [Candidatus Limnocylindria bacterium]
MPLFEKKTDLLSSRERELNLQMARLEAELQKLATEAPVPVPAKPKESAPVTSQPFAPPRESASVPVSGANPAPSHFNDRGVRKFDLLAAWQSLKNHLSGPGGNNPAMAKMLAAGSIHGLRPLRKERRVARNRFIFLFVTLLAVLWGLAYNYLRQR